MHFKEIQNQFISEARSAPILFADLAKVELYIAESYRTRAFAELLQNADDAKATQFIASYQDGNLIIANNGNVFTGDDLIALCRSGSSNKKRDGSTIGYRGIGFKSVVGIANEITVISGELSFRFSKKDAKKILNTEKDVPLIRIPHSLDNNDPSVDLAVKLQKTKNMTTVFVMSGLNIRILEEEVNAFDENSILFINSVRNMDIALPNLRRNIFRKGNLKNGIIIETIYSENETSTWMVINQDSGCEKVAFRYSGESIIPCSNEESLIHAFLPTNDFSGAFLKFNGNFSTDPSRKTVDIDDFSLQSFKICSLLLANSIRKAVSELTFPGIFSALISDSPIQGKFRKILREEFIQLFEKEGFTILHQGLVKPSEIRLAPEWINYNDYEKLCSDLPHLPIKLVNIHPEIAKFFEWIGARKFGIEEAIKMLHKHSPTPLGCVQIISKFARQFRFDMNDERIALISSALILPTQKGMMSPQQYTDEKIDQEFITCLHQLPDNDDIKFLFKRLNLPILLRSSENKIESNIENITNKSSKKILSTFKHSPEIKKWRSAELNAANWFLSLSRVIDVRDVSKANVGYDLEILLKDGQRYHIEVKSVGSFAESFILTNHEYATAYQSGNSYLIALVINSEPFELKLIQNPIKTLILEKRCKQWIWFCEDYSSKFIDIFNIEGEKG